MRYITASHAVTQYSGNLQEMLPHFLVIAAVVAIIIAALVIYTKMKK